MVSRKQLLAWGGKTYRALVSQAGTAAPTAKVLANAFTTPFVWARTGTGTYTLTNAGAFTADKTFLQTRVYDMATGKALNGVRTSANVVTFTNGIIGGAASDVFTDVEVEVVVY